MADIIRLYKVICSSSSSDYLVIERGLLRLGGIKNSMILLTLAVTTIVAKYSKKGFANVSANVHGDLKKK